MTKNEVTVSGRVWGKHFQELFIQKIIISPNHS